jgi:hypothetical protein
MIQLYPILRLRIKTMKILSKLSSFLLSCIPFGENFVEAVGLLSSDCKILNISREELFNEFTYFRTYLLETESEWFSSTALAKK